MHNFPKIQVYMDEIRSHLKAIETELGMGLEKPEMEHEEMESAPPPRRRGRKTKMPRYEEEEE